MDCPTCHKRTNTSEAQNKYFLGRNSGGIPFFKCEQCGNFFYIDETNGTANYVSRGERGRRFVPVTWGILVWIIAIVGYWIFGFNTITWIIGGFLLWFGWSSIKIGLFGSQKFIDEMTLDDKSVGSSKETLEEWKKLNKLD